MKHYAISNGEKYYLHYDEYDAYPSIREAKAKYAADLKENYETEPGYDTSVAVRSGVAADGTRVYVICGYNNGTNANWKALDDIDSWWDAEWDDNVYTYDENDQWIE